jgi:peptidoglycan hydrolase CwlO-like protein
MSTELEVLSPDLVGKQLQRSGIVGTSRGLHLQPLPRNPERLDFSSRRSYRVWSGLKSICYLLTGPRLGGIWNRAQAFARACPEIAAKPLFLQRTSQADFLGLEFIEGVTIEEAGLKPDPDRPLLAQAASHVLESLERTLRPSSVAALQAELERFFASVTACPIFGSLDIGFLREVVFPWIRDGACRQQPQTRWSNGDFIAQNVILGDGGAPRLIDYEYAHRTHFFAEDFVRWDAYSEGNRGIFEAKLGLPSAWLEAYFLLRQTVLEQRTGSPQLALSGAQERVRRLRALSAAAHAQFRASLFLKPLARTGPDRSEAEWQQLSALVDERTLWAQGLDKNFKEAERRIAELQSLAEERTAWAKSLDKDIAELRTNLDAMRAERDQAQGTSGRLQSLADERTQWAQSLEQSLKAAGDRIAELQSLADERTAWAKSLDKDIAGLRASLDAMRAERDQAQGVSGRLQSLADERTQWAQSLEQSLKLAGDRIAELQSLADERTAWVKSLETEISGLRTALGRTETERDRAQDRGDRTEEELRNLEEQLARAQEVTAKILGDLEDKIRWGSSLDSTLANERLEYSRLKSEFDERSSWALSLQQDLAGERARRAYLEDKVRRMQDSFSWSVTSPLRAVRRLFFDPK